MPRGGARVGAGRKPRRQVPPPPSNVTPFQPGVIPGAKGPDAGESVSRKAPKDLPEEQHEFWERYAPLAIERRTLTPQTVPAFRLLCELEAEKLATKETIEKDGRTYLKCTVDGAGQEHEELKAHPLTAPYRQLAQRVEVLMARFGLAPFGKPLSAPAKAKKHWLDELTAS